MVSEMNQFIPSLYIKFKVPVHVGLLCVPGPEICKSFHHCGSIPPAPWLFWVVHTAVVVTEMKNNTIETVNNGSPWSPSEPRDLMQVTFCSVVNAGFYFLQDTFPSKWDYHRQEDPRNTQEHRTCVC